MHISKIKLANFKRFTELTIDLSSNEPAPKLVLLIGANGSGKSSLFDAFEWVSLDIKAQVSPTTPIFRTDYYGKENKKAYVKIEFSNGDFLKQRELEQYDRGNITNVEYSRRFNSNLFYGRSAFRHSPYITTNNKTANITTDSDRPKFLIDSDQRFINDVPTFVNKILSEVFNEKNKVVGEVLRERYIVPINKALANIFGEEPSTSLSLVNISLPTIDDFLEITFRKGSSEFGYELLSSGEKEIFGILLNLLVRRESFQDTIYFIDELDVHLNTSLQRALLKEITENWIPENCQFWTASHSLGFIQYARESEKAVILDFNQLDFDIPQILVPQPKETLEVFEVAVPKEVIFQIFDDKQVVLCENKDDDYFNLLNLENKIFVGVQNKDEVFRNIKANPKYFGLIDRDYLTDNEVNTLRQRYPNLFILDFYASENYLYHPDNIKEVVPDLDVKAYKEELVKQKNLSLTERLIYLEKSRDSYKFLKDENMRDKDVLPIAEALKSDNFVDFYRFFNLKGSNRAYLNKYNLAPKNLAQTNWFQQAIEEIFSRSRQSSNPK
jgi:AAA15 family ATPase/GTPase